MDSEDEKGLYEEVERIELEEVRRLEKSLEWARARLANTQLLISLDDALDGQIGPEREEVLRLIDDAMARRNELGAMPGDGPGVEAKADTRHIVPVDAEGHELPPAPPCAPEDHEWVVFSTMIGPECAILVECDTCGAIGKVEDYTSEEWSLSYYAPSRPFRWADETRVIVRELPAA